MARASFIWIPLAVGAMVATASPLAAQQTAPAGQPAPQQLAPPVPQNSSDLPPPFPHYPARAPREHDPNYHPSTHRHAHSQPARSTKAHHQAKASHSAKISHHSKTARHAKASDRGARSKARAKRQYFSKRTIRQCHGMTYKQIMAHRYCRVMIQQELAAQPSHRSKAHKPAHTRKSAPARKAHHHRR